MRITKIGHSCLVVEEGGTKILIDPGTYSTGQNDIKGVDIVLITHEHPDHLSVESLKEVIANNPRATIYTNSGVGKILSEEKVPYMELLSGQSIEVKGVSIEGVGRDHAVLHNLIPVVHNVGYIIAGRFFHPGDALQKLDRPIEILALPVVASWMRLAEGIEYAKIIKPKVAFPIHDGMLRSDRMGPIHFLPEKVLTPLGIRFVVIKEGSTKEF